MLLLSTLTTAVDKSDKATISSYDIAAVTANLTNDKLSLMLEAKGSTTYWGYQYSAGQWGDALFKVERCLPIFSFRRDPAGVVTLISGIFSMRKRLEVEAARRGQSVPTVHKPEIYSNL